MYVSRTRHKSRPTYKGEEVERYPYTARANKVQEDSYLGQRARIQGNNEATHMSSLISTCSAVTSDEALRWMLIIAFCSSEFDFLRVFEC